MYENIRIRVFELNRDHKKKSDVGEYLSNKSTLILFFFNTNVCSAYIYFD